MRIGSISRPSDARPTKQTNNPTTNDRSRSGSDNNRSTTTSHDSIRKDILKSALVGQQTSETNQVELRKQGERLGVSLNLANNITKNQLKSTKKLIKELEHEAEVAGYGKTALCLNCLLTPFRYLVSPCTRSNANEIHTTIDLNDNNLKDSDTDAMIESLNQDKSPVSPETIASSDLILEERDNYNNTKFLQTSSQNGPISLERVKKLMSDTNPGQGWRRTPKPPPGSSFINQSIWIKQIDLSLKKLDRMNEDLGQTLEEQINLAHMLTLSLNQGTYHIGNINDQIETANKKIFSRI